MTENDRASRNDKVGTVTFSLDDTSHRYDMGFSLDETFKTGSSTDVSLGDYLKRPVRILSYNPGVGVREKTSLNPWSQFLNDLEVSKKIEGFRFLRGNLHLRVTITGGPFTYGKWHMTYDPRHVTDSYPSPGATSGTRYIWATSRPHVTLDATESKGGEMVLPFFCPTNYLDLQESSDVDSMGEIHFYTASVLRHINDSNATCTISLFAWMENVELCCPTGSALAWTRQANTEALVSAGAGVFSAIFTFIGLFMAYWEKMKQSMARAVIKEHSQRGVEQSEHASSPVSKTASAVARASQLAGNLIPEIRPYAMATTAIATTLGNIAHIFGFSRPAVLSNISRYREFIAGELAPTNTHDVFSRLSYDCKGELSIDPRTVGLAPIDELSIPYICGIAAHVDNLKWSHTDVVGSAIGEVNVTPLHFQTNTLTATNSSLLSPVGAVSQLFKYWRGTLVFRFQIVASAVHRGKIRIIYDPLGVSANVGFNEVYSRIVDLSQTRDVEIPIEWHAGTPWLNVRSLQAGSTTDFNIGNTINNDPNFDNGELRLVVLEPLTSSNPLASDDIDIMVSVKAAPNIEFAAPSTRLNDYRFTSPDVGGVPQSLDLSPENDDAGESPVSGNPIEPIGNVTTPAQNHISKVFFGESITSLRTLMKRYSFRGQGSGSDFNRPVRGINSSSTPMAFCMHEYITNMYKGWRGSTRYKYVEHADSSVPSTFEVVCGYAADLNANLDLMSMLGLHINRGCAEFEVPYYSIFRFSPARTHPQFATDYKEQNAEDMNNFRFSVSTLASNSWHAFRSVGEDYTLFFFVGPPPMYAAP